jgi:hypothetical protein
MLELLWHLLQVDGELADENKETIVVVNLGIIILSSGFGN